MTREELLQECFGRSDFPPPLRTFSLQDETTGDVLSSVDVYRRIVRIRYPRGRGEVSDAASTMSVAALAQVCTDPAHRGKGYASAAIRLAHVELREHKPLLFAALVGDVGFYGRLGYFHPEGAADANFLVFKLGDDDWPAGRVTTVGAW